VAFGAATLTSNIDKLVVCTVRRVTESDQKAVLLRYLDDARRALLWKLDGLSEYDARRPVTRTGTNVLGVVKHVAMVEGGYLGACFDRPVPGPEPRFEPGDDNSDMWATADESREFVVEYYARVAENSASTVAALPLDARATVAHWPVERRHPTLHELLVRMVAETNRHAGHVDVVRETIDGRAGLRPGTTNLPDVDDGWWTAYVERLEAVAREF
jgi:uncharacterized damage-inducible protein DinB